jgi:hypothetical protein
MKGIPVKKAILAIVMLVILSGCFYPSEQRVENQLPVEDYMRVVQRGVDQFKEERGIIPIKTKPNDTDIFEKYMINFSQLVPKYFPSVPPNAFEQGGEYLYVLVDVESPQPLVRLLDLVTVQTVGDVQQGVELYRSRNGEYPFEQEVDPGFYTIDFKKVKVKETQVRSPYSNQFLPLLLHESGQVIVDYRMEIMRQLNRIGLDQISPDEDLRRILYDNSFYVPARSVPYQLTDGEPMPVSPK